MTRVSKFAALTLMIGLSLTSTNAFAKEIKFDVNDPTGRDSVSFNSNAPIEVIIGHTNKITGTVSVDDSLDLSKQPISAQFDVDLASIDTGIALRNEHMRDNFLETKQFPKATFKLKSIASGATVLKDKQKVHLEANGDFTLHGKTVQKKVPIDVTYFKMCPATEGKFKNCDLIQITSTFPVAFKDHDIKRPEVVFQKLADTVFVTVSASAHKEVSAATKAPEKTAPKPPVKK
ncbi:MAG: YceI family protein [Candidatus Melainabacteria bacterium]|nr:YceI family protein [Candidatus Melainabacteria bacterium]